MPNLDDVRITYVGGPTILLDVGGLRLLTDPTFDLPRDYQAGPFILSKTVGPAFPTDTLGEIDAVLLSHDHHFDNLDQAGRELLSKVKQVLTTTAGAERLQGNAIGLEVWQSIDLPAPNGKILSITGTPARHGPAGGDRGPVIGFLLSYKDSRDEPIYISGDTVWYEGVEETLERFPNIHVAVLFVGAARVPVLPANLTFSAAEAVRVAEALPKARIVPVHFEGWKHLTESKDDLTNTFAVAGRKDQLLWLPVGKTVPLSTFKAD